MRRTRTALATILTGSHNGENIRTFSAIADARRRQLPAAPIQQQGRRRLLQ